MHFKPSAGGLATGLNSLDSSLNRLWIGWPGLSIDTDAGQTAAPFRVLQFVRVEKLTFTNFSSIICNVFPLQKSHIKQAR